MGPQGLHHALGVPAKKRLEKGFLRGVGGLSPKAPKGQVRRLASSSR